MNGTAIGLTKNPNDNQQYVAPYRYAFFRNGECLGRIIWTRNVEDIYLDQCDSEWGL